MGENIRSVQLAELYRKGVASLLRAGIDDPDLDVAMVVGHVLGLDRAGVILAMDTGVPMELARKIESCLARRCRQEPLAYILGEWEFWSLSFAVSPDVLVPRPETEVVVEQVRAVFGERGRVTGPILDMGTGSGILAVTLALEFPEATVFALDCSLPAMRIAMENSRRHGCEKRVHGLVSSWAGGISPASRFEIIVTNPPYVARELCLGRSGPEDHLVLSPGVLAHEPLLALDGGPGGMESIRSIAADLSWLLRPGGWFFMEIGADQEKETVALFAGLNVFDQVTAVPDYAGLPRVVKARRKPV